MADHYLEFEKPIQDIDLKIIELQADSSSTDHSSEIAILETKRKSSLKKIFSELSRWQRVQLARHPQRPFSLDYIQAICSHIQQDLCDKGPCLFTSLTSL